MRFRPSIFIPVAVLVVGACGGGGDSSSGSNSTPTSPTTPTTPTTPSNPTATNQVEVDNDIFSPSNITVPVNTAVHWTWSTDASLHNVTFQDGTASGDKTAGGTFDKTFPTAGTFSYRCTIHVGMTGSVVVTQ